MIVKRKDFQKTSAHIHQFLVKLDYAPECAEVRDALNLALLHMQKYYRYQRKRLENKDKDCASLSNSSLRGLSPMTPPLDLQDKFQWRWQELDGRRMSLLRSQEPGLPLGMPLALSACKTGDMETLKALYSNNPGCLEESDGLGRTLLMYSVHYEQYPTAEWLLRCGANVNAQAHDQSTALHVAAHQGQWSFTELLVKHAAKVDCQDCLGRSPMHWAVTTSTTECLKILVRHKANPSLRDADHATPSMWACHLDNIDHFSILSGLLRIDEFADGMERDVNGRTFLHWAVRRQEPLECLKTLITESNAVVTDMAGKNVLLVAAEQGSLPACKIIIDVCGKSIIDYRDEDDRSAVHLATIGGHGEVLNYLLDQGANMELRDRDNGTPWDYAKQRQLNYCKLILASHSRQRCKDLELASQNSLQDHMRTFSMEMLPRPPSTPPSNRSKSPSTSRRRLVISSSRQESLDATNGGGSPMVLPARSSVAAAAAAYNDRDDASVAFERRGGSQNEEISGYPHDQQQPVMLESYRTLDSRADFADDSASIAAVASSTLMNLQQQQQHQRRPTAARGGRRPLASPQGATPSPQPQSPQHQPSSNNSNSNSRAPSTASPTDSRRLTMRSQPPYKLQRQAAGENGAGAAVATDAAGRVLSPPSGPQPPPPPQFQMSDGGEASQAGSVSSGAGFEQAAMRGNFANHPPRTPPEKQRPVGPPAQLMPLSLPAAVGLQHLQQQQQQQQQHLHLQNAQFQQQPPVSGLGRKKKKAKGRRGLSGQLQQQQNGFAGGVASIAQPQNLTTTGSWLGYPRPTDLPPPRSVVPRSASSSSSAAAVAAAGGFIPPPQGFGNASGENSPRDAGLSSQQQESPSRQSRQPLVPSTAVGGGNRQHLQQQPQLVLAEAPRPQPQPPPQPRPPPLHFSATRRPIPSSADGGGRGVGGTLG